VQLAGTSEAVTAPWSALGGTHEGTCASSSVGEDPAGRGLSLDSSSGRVDIATGRGLMH
jgi:hypothetical protein